MIPGRASASIVAATAGAATSSGAGALGGHLAHLVEGVGFIAVSLGGILVSEAVQRRRRRGGAAAGDGRSVVLSDPLAVTGAAPWFEPTGVTAAGGARQLVLPLVGLGSIAAAAVHLVVMPEHFDESLLYGVFFAVLAILQAGLGIFTLARPERTPLIALLAGNVAVIVLWTITRTFGIPLGPAAGSVEAVGALDVLATGLEATVVAGSAILLWRLPTPAALRPSTWAPLAWCFLVVAAVAIPVIVVISPPS